MLKNPPANARDAGDVSLIPGSGRSPGRGHGNPLQYSCLENPMDRGAWRAMVHGVAKSRTRLKQLNVQVSLGCIYYCESLPSHTFATVDRKSLVALGQWFSAWTVHHCHLGDWRLSLGWERTLWRVGS